jgi:di/tricarboxylate transporter
VGVTASEVLDISPELISILALALMFVIATIRPVNMGVLAFAGAFLVGTLVADLATEDIFAGFPSDLFLTLVGITYLFAIAQNNGTIDWLVQQAVRAVRGQVAAIPWIMFGIAALLTAVGAVSPGAVAIVAPIALGFAAQYGINPLMIGLMVIHGAQAGGFSPISIYGGITNGVVEEAGLPLNEIATFLASLVVNTAVAAALFVAMGGLRLVGKRVDLATVGASDADEGVPAAEGDRGADDPRRRDTRATEPPAGEQQYGDAEDEALTAREPGSPVEERAEPSAPTGGGPTAYQLLTILGIIALAVLALAFELDIGFVAITIGLVLALIAPETQKAAVGQVAWPEILLITGVATYVGVLEEMGTIDYVGEEVADFGAPLIAALLLCFIGAIVSAFASSTAVLGSLIPLAVPFLEGEASIGAVGFIAAFAVSSTIVDVSPFSTNGALVLANAPRGVDREVFFRSLLRYGALVTVAAPPVLWLIFVVIG